MYELIMLSLLMRFPLNRYQLAKVVNDKLGPYAKLSNGTLYPLLAKMEQMGLVVAPVQDLQETRREHPSRLFHITNIGRQRFHQLMMDTTSFQSDYQRIFLFKLSSLDLLPLTNRLYLLNHYVSYCQAHVLHFTTEAQSLTQDIASFAGSLLVFQGRSLAAINHLVEHWHSEAAWAMQLYKEEQDRAEASPEGRAQSEETTSDF